jgi:hypothetical protein
MAGSAALSIFSGRSAPDGAAEDSARALEPGAVERHFARLEPRIRPKLAEDVPGYNR